jgi:hypothetical protein
LSTEDEFLGGLLHGSAGEHIIAAGFRDEAFVRPFDSGDAVMPAGAVSQAG